MNIRKSQLQNWQTLVHLDSCLMPITFCMLLVYLGLRLRLGQASIWQLIGIPGRCLHCSPSPPPLSSFSTSLFIFLPSPIPHYTGLVCMYFLGKYGPKFVNLPLCAPWLLLPKCLFLCMQCILFCLTCTTLNKYFYWQKKANELRGPITPCNIKRKGLIEYSWVVGASLPVVMLCNLLWWD